METIRMRIEKTVDHNGKRYGLGSGGLWYNGFGKAPCSEGDVVDLTIEEVEKGGQTYYNVKECVIVKENAPEPTTKTIVQSNGLRYDVPVDDKRGKAINRAVALKGAVDLSWMMEKDDSPTTTKVAWIIAVARQLEVYLNE